MTGNQVQQSNLSVPLTVLYRDELLVAIDKPAGSLIHRSMLSCDESGFILQRLRDQLRQRVYPVQRLDRPTSGVLLFALDSDSARGLAQQFEAHQVDKRYLAVVRGWPGAEGEIDYPLVDEVSGRSQEALTRWRRLATIDLPVPVSRYPSSRYALLEVLPQSGRRHQIRRHFKHIHHPLIGDTSYGEGRHNRYFRQQYGLNRLLLHAHHLAFKHPADGRPTGISATPDLQWQSLAAQFAWQLSSPAGVHCPSNRQDERQ